MSGYDPFEGVSGGFESGTFTFLGASFGSDARYKGDGSYPVVGIIHNLNEDSGTEDDFLLSIGTGWEPRDDGARVVRADGSEPRGFIKSTAYQQFLIAAVEAGAGDVIRGRGMPWEAAIWTGLRFEMERFDYKDMNGKDRWRPQPSKYLGLADASEAAPAADDGVLAKLHELAFASATHEDFVEASFAIVEGNSSLVSKVLDPGFYASLRS